MQLRQVSLLYLGVALVLRCGAVCPINSQTTVVYYAGSGATADCQSWEEHFFNWWATAEPRIKYHRLTALNVKKDCDFSQASTLFPNLRVYAQPGGNAYQQQNGLGPEGKKNILNWIHSGQGIYMGTCAGFFYASTNYWWQGVHYDWPDLMGAYGNEVEGSITEVWDDDVAPGYSTTTVTDGVSEHNALYWGGPTRGYNNTAATTPGKTLLNFKYRDLLAGVQTGNLLLWTVHLEAFEGNPSSHQSPSNNNLSKSDVFQNYKFRAEAINKASNLDWKIPNSYP